MQAGIRFLMIRLKTVVRTLIPKMAITMTTRQPKLTREAARDWPLFSEDDVPSEMGVLSIQVQRRSGESIDLAATNVSALLATALTPVLEAQRCRLWLVALGSPVSRSSKLAAYRAERDALWGTWEAAGVHLPGGSRSEMEMANSPEVLRFAGCIELPSGNDLQIALEVTRRENALVLGQLNGHDDLDPIGFLASLNPLPADSVGLLRATVRQLGGEYFAVRSFGWFDDVEVGVEVFAQTSVLNNLELALNVAKGKDVGLG